VSKRTDSPGLGSLGSAALTAASLLVVTGFAGIIGVVIAREFGRTEETDGFFAAYGVFIVVALAAQAIRVAVIPALTRAREERRLAGELLGFASALAAVALPLLLAAELGAEPIASLLTGGDSEAARDAAVEALRWMVPAAVAHLFAGLAASGLAALDDYATAAFGYAAGSTAGLALILARVGEDGIEAVAWGMALNGAIALAVPVAVLALRGRSARMPASAVRPSGQSLSTRLAVFGAAASLPIALQLLYVLCLPFAGRLGIGAVTSFGYAYLAASSIVSVTASSIGLVTSAPLTRAAAGGTTYARHVVASAWVALTVVAAAVGVFAVTGAGIVEGVLGDAYGDEVGREVARLVVALSPWMVAMVGVTVAFPLAFVASRVRALPWIGLAALPVQLVLAWAGAEALELEGLAFALAVSTLLVLVGLLLQLEALEPALRGLAAAALALGGVALVSFAPPALVLGSWGAAALGLLAYGAVLAAVHPAALTGGWRYLRTLG
jgi:hypothetical protein